MNGYWCTPWASNPSAGSNKVCGRSNSYTLPPLYKVFMRYRDISSNKLIAGEIIAGIVGTLIVAFIFTFVSSMMKNSQNSILNVILAIILWSVLIFVSASAVYLVGKYNHKNSSFLFTLSGSFLGFGICLLSTYIINTFKVFG